MRATTLRPVVLRADLGEPSLRWRFVVAIPFGARPDELGEIPVGRRSPVPMVPFAFAVAPDRSFWILDEVKLRVAHYSPSGRFIGDLGGLRFDRLHAHPRDLVMAGDRPIVLEQGNWSLAGIVDVPVRGGFDRTPVSIAGRPVWVSYLAATSGAVVGWVNGRAVAPPAPPDPRPRGAARFDVPGSGRGRLIPGIPLGDGGFARMEYRHPQHFDVTFTKGDVRSVLPIHFALVGGGRTVTGAAAVISETPVRHGLAAVVQIAPTDPGDARRFGDGRWFLRVADDGSPLQWERLAKPVFDDETVVRHLSTGPHDSIYLMRVSRRGVTLYRR